MLDGAEISEVLYIYRAREPHANPDLFRFQFLTKNHQNSTWKSLHVSHNIIVYNEICHKYIYIMGWKDQISKEIATCQNFGSPENLLWESRCWDAQGISCTFCAIAIQIYTA